MRITDPIRALAALLLATLSLGLHADDAPAQLRIGFQKDSVGIVLARQHHLLEQRFPHTRISYVEFPAGPQLLEALNAGSIDLGPTGDTPPIFAQAAGIDLLYVGLEPERPQAEAVLVGKDSPIRTPADLKGRRIALQKGSSSHNLLLQVLARAHLGIADVEPVYLAPADARAAFASGAVDAWAIWDPYYAAAALDGRARVLADGRGLPGIGANYYLAARAYAQAHPAFLANVLAAVGEADALPRSDRAGSVRELAAYMGLPPAVVALYLDHLPAGYTVRPMDAAAVHAQQQIADAFYRSRLLPRPVQVAAIVWKPPATSQPAAASNRPAALESPP
jgi:sulfonate transport system substrate-binding protein